MSRGPEYEDDPDGYLREVVGPWALEKHQRVCDFVASAWGARRRFIEEWGQQATYTELFCGPGRIKIRATPTVDDGSAVKAWKESKYVGKAPFTQVHVGDLEPRLALAAEYRLAAAGAPVKRYEGAAIVTVHEVAKELDSNGLHLAFLDPHNLETLEFSIIERLATFKHIDIIVHFSVSDETRNWDTYIDSPRSALDTFAPGWRTKVDVMRGRRVGRRKLFEYWCSLVSGIGLNVSKVVHEVKNQRRVPLYWLLLLSRHPLPEKLWSTTSGNKQGELFV